MIWTGQLHVTFTYESNINLKYLPQPLFSDFHMVSLRRDAYQVTTGEEEKAGANLYKDGTRLGTTTTKFRKQ